MENEKKRKRGERKEREGEIRAGADRGDDRGAGRPRAHCDAGQTATHAGRGEMGDETMIEIGCRDREKFLGRVFREIRSSGGERTLIGLSSTTKKF